MLNSTQKAFGDRLARAVCSYQRIAERWPDHRGDVPWWAGLAVELHQVFRDWRPALGEHSPQISFAPGHIDMRIEVNGAYLDRWRLRLLVHGGGLEAELQPWE